MHEIEICFEGVSWSGVEGCLTDICACALIYFSFEAFLSAVEKFQLTSTSTSKKNNVEAY